MSTDHTQICVADDHDYTIINIRQMNGHQTPLIKCERCDTVWHNHTPARPGDLILIPTHERPTDEHLTAISDLANKTGVMLLLVDTNPHNLTQSTLNAAYDQSGVLPQSTAVNNSGHPVPVLTHTPGEAAQENP